MKAQPKGEAWRSLLPKVALALFIWAPCAALEMAAEHFGWLEGTYPHIYRILHGFRRESADPSLNLLLVDVSDWTSTNGIENHPNVEGLQIRRRPDLCNRSALQALLVQLRRLGPSAIGFAIDLSPEDRFRPMPKEHFEFLDACLALSGSTPVFVGVGRTMLGGPEEWLAHPKYTNLAASVWRQRGANVMMPERYEWAHYGGTVSLRTLPQALAESAWKQGVINPVKPPWPIKHLLAPPRPIRTSGPPRALSGTRFLIDYQDLPHLRRDRQGVESASDLLEKVLLDRREVELRKRWAGAVFLVGDARESEMSGSANVPVTDEPVPDLYVHANALNTLLSRPLYELAHKYSLLLSLTVLLVSVAAREVVLRSFAPAWLQLPLELPLSWLVTSFAALVGLLGWRVMPLGLAANIVSQLLEFLISVGRHTKIGTVPKWMRRSMTKPIPGSLMVFVLLLLLPRDGTAADENRRFVCYIDEVRGDVTLIATGSVLRTIQITPTDRYKPLYEGDEIRCSRGAWISVFFPSGKTMKWEGTGGAMISPKLEEGGAVTPSTQYKVLVASGLVASGRRMGVGPGRVFRPAEGSVQLPTNALIQWNRASRGAFTIRLMDGANREVWSKEMPDGEGQQSVVAPELPRILQRSRAAGSFTLELEAGGGAAQVSTFSVLSERKAQDFYAARKKLQEISPVEERLLATAGLCRTIGLLNEAADAYDELLRVPSAEQNSYLVKRALDFHEIIGNHSRASVLRSMLKVLDSR